MAVKSGIEVIGLNEFRAALRAASLELPKELRLGMNEVAEQILLPEVIKRVKYRTPPNTPYLTAKSRAKKGALLRSVRAQSTQRTGQVKEGFNTRVEHAGWWEFGGKTNSPIYGKGIRKKVQAGRAMYPALVSKRGEILAAMEIVLSRLSAKLEAA